MINQIEARLMGIKTTAKQLDLTEWALRNLVARGRIPVVRIGRRVMFDRRAIDKWIAHHSQEEVRS